MPGPRGGLRAVGAAVALALAASACGGAGASPADDSLTDAEREYLGDVVDALSRFEEANRRFGEALSQTYQTNEAVFAALEQAGAGTAFEPGLAELEALDPPPRFVDDHELLLERQRSQVLIDRDIGAAVADADLERFVLLNMRLSLVSSHGAVELEPAACETVLRFELDEHPSGAAYLAEALCDRSPLPGDGYGERVREILREATIDISSRGDALGFFQIVPVVPDDAFLEVANEAFTEIAAAARGARRQIADLEPPDRMATDHDRLVAYLDRVEARMDELLAAAVAGDRQAFEDDALAEIYCQARDEVGFAYREIVRVHFADLFAFCEGSPPF